jgi:hypothetical protein
MSTTKKIFLPKWQRWFILPFFVGIWLFFTYMEFFNQNNTEKMGLVGYIFMSILFWGLAVMMWLMTSGKLPAYIIKEKKEKEKETDSES